MIIILPCYLSVQVTSYFKHKYIFIFKIDRVYRTFKQIHSMYEIDIPEKGQLIYIYMIYVHYRALLVNIKCICTIIPLRRGVLDTTLYDKVFQWLATCRWFSPGTPGSTTNKTDRHDIAEILLKVTLNTRIQTYLYEFINSQKCEPWTRCVYLFCSKCKLIW